MKHWHHIIPKHAGGTDDESNLMQLTIEEHADAHRILYETFGRWQDRVAWLSLSGIMLDEERIYEIISNANKGNPSGYRHSNETKAKLSAIKVGELNPQFGKPAANRGVKRPGIGGRKRGTKWSEEERKKQIEIRSRDGFYSFTQNTDRNEKIKQARLGKTGAAAGKFWYTNGEIETYATECLVGFWKGRKPRTSNKKGMCWYNNSIVNKQFRIGEELEGFTRGRICKK
jgi:hypothetical protein